jgi:Na+-transporting methylmalonyl-CoA/oxaloacetate decarboxylase gamma subunit
MARVSTVSKKKTSFGTSMGVSSIIAILVILVLVVFSALSIATSKADLVLSQKTSDSVKAFYAADSSAEETLAAVAAAIDEGDGWEARIGVLGCDVKDDLISYVVVVDENRNLDIRLRAHPDGKITRELWQIVPATEWVADDTVSLYMPEQR